MNHYSAADLTIAPAAGADIGDILAILNEHCLPTAGVAEHLGTFLVAKVDQRVVGVCGLEVHGQYALLRSVAVTEQLRKHRIGERLVTEALGMAEQLNLQSLYLLTTTAETYFVGKGFTVIKREDVPTPLLASAEFQGACPASATIMSRILRPLGTSPSTPPLEVV